MGDTTKMKYLNEMPKADRSRVYSYKDVDDARREGYIAGLKETIGEAVASKLLGKVLGSQMSEEQSDLAGNTNVGA